MCVKGCFLVPSGETNFQDLTFEKCASKHCIEDELSGYWFDPKCIEENRDAIVACCKNNCVPKADLDCDKACEWEVDITTHPGEVATAGDGDGEDDVFLPTLEKRWVDSRNSAGMLDTEAISKAAREIREEPWHNKSMKSLLIGVGTAVGIIALFLTTLFIWRHLRK